MTFYVSGECIFALPGNQGTWEWGWGGGANDAFEFLKKKECRRTTTCLGSSFLHPNQCLILLLLHPHQKGASHNTITTNDPSKVAISLLARSLFVAHSGRVLLTQRATVCICSQCFIRLLQLNDNLYADAVFAAACVLFVEGRDGGKALLHRTL